MAKKILSAPEQQMAEELAKRLTIRSEHSIEQLLQFHDWGWDLGNGDLERLLHYYKSKWESCSCACICQQSEGPTSTLRSVPLPSDSPERLPEFAPYAPVQ